MTSQITSGSEIKSPISVGQEFIEWAEQYWQLKQNFKMENPDAFAGERCGYDYMRDCFIKKINSIIAERVSNLIAK